MRTDMKIPAIREDKIKRPGSRKLLFLLVLFFLLVLAVLFFRSSLSKVAVIEITGNDLVPDEDISSAAGVKTGEQYFLVQPAVIRKNVKSIRAIDKVQVDKHFPGLIRIAVQEQPRAAYQMAEGGGIEALLADGSALPLNDAAVPPDKPFLTGWSEDNPLKAELCRVLAGIPASLLADVSEIRPNPSNAYEDKIKLYTRSRFEVVTRISLLSEKMQSLAYFIGEYLEKNGEPGVLTLMDTDRGAPYENNLKNGENKK